MRVRHVSVTKLFGLFDHEIPLQDGRITILHGLNGTGKTITLQMIRESLTGELDVLHSVPYERFELRFDDGSSLQVSEPNAFGPIFVRVPANGPEEVSRSMDSGTLSVHGLTKLRASIHVRLLETTRLLHIEKTRDEHSAPPEGTTPLPPLHPSVRLSPHVQELSAEIAQRIEQRRSEYTETSQDLDQSFPARILSKNGAAPLSSEELRRRLAGLGEKHDKLSSLGILSPAEIVRDVPDETDSSTLKTLSVYVRDNEQKLAFFDDLAARIELLTELVNARFRYNRFAIARGRGFVLTTPNGRDLPLGRLSSGEQHELVMFYELLFRMERDTLVLIDEPEISLHLLWQQQFLDDLQKVVNLVGLDVIVATHSTDIIDKHWDWTVALEGQLP